jgi:hypothetical protein
VEKILGCESQQGNQEDTGFSIPGLRLAVPETSDLCQVVLANIRFSDDGKVNKMQEKCCSEDSANVTGLI